MDLFWQVFALDAQMTSAGAEERSSFTHLFQ